MSSNTTQSQACEGTCHAVPKGGDHPLPPWHPLIASAVSLLAACVMNQRRAAGETLFWHVVISVTVRVGEAGFCEVTDRKCRSLYLFSFYLFKSLRMHSYSQWRPDKGLLRKWKGCEHDR